MKKESASPQRGTQMMKKFHRIIKALPNELNFPEFLTSALSISSN